MLSGGMYTPQESSLGPYPEASGSRPEAPEVTHRQSDDEPYMSTRVEGEGDAAQELLDVPAAGVRPYDGHPVEDVQDAEKVTEPLCTVQETEGQEVQEQAAETEDAHMHVTGLESFLHTTLEGRYRISQYIGGGVFGSVWKAQDLNTNDWVAVKVIRQDDDYEGMQPSVIREISLLRGFEHDNVVRLLDVILPQDGNEFQLVFEFIDMDLGRVMQQVRHNQKQLPLEFIVHYTRDLLEGIHACHIRLILHRDLKPHNLLIGPRGLKIADFGLARVMAAQARTYTVEVVTLWYRAPELLLGATKYGNEVDLWSAGCIVAEMALTKPLFSGTSEIDTIFKIFQLLGTPREDTYPGITSLDHWQPTFPQWKGQSVAPIITRRPELGEEGRLLLCGLLEMHPPSRLSARRAKMHPFCSLQRQPQYGYASAPGVEAVATSAVK